ncbi:phage tail spike protein [Levilactobacillus senmaizukei]|uniref:phage tail spike protein n=2 Tax=Levilactobacillus senmaizukei TaxID=431273 RepID=UPI00077BD583|nr:phage tail spike protein [Levilactobacillus senmaizukei]
MIQLYGWDERDFQGHNGRVLSAVSNDTITWSLNTQFDFQFDYPLFAKHGLSIQNEMIITAPVPGYDDQAFRVNSVEKSMGVLTVHAYHVFWDLMQNFVEDINIVEKTGADAVQHIMESTQFPHEFTYNSFVGNVANARIVRMSPIAALIGTDDNTLISRWGGEFEWDNFHFNHVAQLGKDRGVVFRNRRNLLGYKATEDLTNTVTRIMPEGYNGLFLPELYVDSPLIDNYTTPRIAKIEYSDIKAIDEDSVSADGEVDPDAIPKDEALIALREAATKEFSKNHIDRPGEQYELNVVMLEDTEEYKDSGIFSRVYPGDTATFIHDEDDLNVKARMTGYTWSPSTEQYLTQSYLSSTNLRGGSDIEHKIDSIGNQLTVIDQAIVKKAANQSNTVGWSSQTPPDIIGSKEGDIWYQNVGVHVIMWLYHDGRWQEAVSDIAGHDATNITEGTFNAAAINVINLNANSIVTGFLNANRIKAGQISGTNLNINLDTGAVEFKKGYITGNNGRIRFDLDRSYFQSYSAANRGFSINDGGFYFYDNFLSSNKTEVGRFSADILSNNTAGLSIGSDTGISLNAGGQSISIGQGGLHNSGVGLVGDVYVMGNLDVMNSKNAVHVTRDGLRATPAYETAESYLGDIGEGKTDKLKTTRVEIEPLFLDTVNTDISYQVFLQSYSSASVWVASREVGFFIVESDTPEANFGWEIKAKRRGHEDERLVPTEVDVKDYAKNVDGMED